MRVAHKGMILIIMLATSSYAGVVVYRQYPNSVTITSQPEVTTGFSYSDGSGNSISVNQTRFIPVFLQQYPNAIWIRMSGGSVPPNAIIVQYTNGYPNYYCRVQTGDGIFYGFVVSNQGCSVSEYPRVIFSSYDTLSR